MRKIFVLAILSIAIISCNRNGLENTHSIKEIKIEFKNKLFFIGPELDSASAKIVADCDCCGSDLAFISDSTFLFASYCLEGDSYSKGKYLIQGKKLNLYFDSLTVSTIYNAEIEDSISTPIDSIVIERNKPHLSSMNVSLYKSKPLLTLKHPNGMEYGMESEQFSINEFLEIAKAKGVLERIK